MRANPKICYPIVAPNIDTVRREIEREQHRYDAFEVWVDYLDDPALESLGTLAGDFGERLLVLLRRKGLDPVRLPLETRCRIISLLGNTSAFLDLDVNTQEAELRYLQELPAKPGLIASAHYYQDTPDDAGLEEALARMDPYNPAIYKISAMCRTPDDAIRLLKLGLQLQSSGKRHIVLGMGLHGAVTRIFGTLWSNELVFAPPRLEVSSAPGQLSRDGLGTIFRILKEECGG